MRLALLLLLASTSALAAPPGQPADEPDVTYAVAINPPLRWADANALAGSIYAGFLDHHALRINVATFANTSNPIGDLISVAAGGDGDEALYRGRRTDVGIAWQYYPRRLWSGFSLEAGLLRRSIDVSEEDEFAAPEYEAEQSVGYAARALVGYSWLWSDRFFLAIAAGASAGRYTGTQTTAQTSYMPEYVTHDFVRWRAGGELYMRIGVSFGQ